MTTRDVTEADFDAVLADNAAPDTGDGTVLPTWSSVLVVVAHPDDESFGLGAVIDAFVGGGASVHVLCLTRGEASSLGAEATRDLGAVRAAELEEAGAALGVTGTTLKDYADGDLAHGPDAAVVEDVVAAIRAQHPDGLLVFEPHGVTAHPDHVAATAFAILAADRECLPVLAWTLPTQVAATLAAEYGAGLHGDAASDIDIVLTVDRARQRRAIAAHASQAVPGSILWRRLELLGDREYLRWLKPPA